MLGCIRKRSLLLLLAVSGAAALSSVANAADPITLKLGVVTSLSAPGQYELGIEAKEAVEACVAWNNAKGDNLTMEIVGVADDKGDPAAGQAAVRRLSQQGAQAFLGEMSSAVSIAEVPVINQYGSVFMLTGSWADELTGPANPSVFRTTGYNSGLVHGTVDFLKKLNETQGVTRVAALVEDSAFGLGMSKTLTEAVAAGAPGVTLQSEVYPADTGDVTPQLLAIKRGEPQMIILISTRQARNLAVKQAREVGLADAQIYAIWNWPEYGDFWEVAGDAGTGILYSTFEAQGAEPSAMAKEAEAAIGKPPSIWARWTWDACVALREGALKAGSSEPAELTKGLESVSFEGATGPVSFSSSEQNYHNREDIPVFIMKLEKPGDGQKEAVLEFPK